MPDKSTSGSRIVSLLPSATEIVYALGLEERLVGVRTSATIRKRRAVNRS